ncbi:GNAT family N-acetyltransferase [Halopiger xanaduensis]|uniref:GCN5-related N-acetyltransferase n=1 Tax=Halopiger xanaduensis (strain DSM 18323 / JCM 14033 / SH-6) TaxID=797210 RepID=F8D724_HALXS|nr:GNAT family N-acetyltransferase [Halopiger xanaduensis]AEH35455.1 GCN5-related N-acetyltransferase [Halopiger xanaduensis SH-6]
MGDELYVRRYRAADRDRVRELHEAAMRDVGAYAEDRPDEDLEAIRETYLEAGGAFLVGEIDARIVAIGAFRPPGDDHYLEHFVDLPASAVVLTRMRVEPEHQRRGYGQRIYEALEARARDRGYAAIVLDTMARQTAARGLYEANGFEEVRRERVETFEEPFDLLVYRKSLSESA